MTQDLNLYTMQTLFEQPLEPIDFLVDGLFAQGLYILGGSPKVGKSWLALQLCLAVCTGTPFLGRETHQDEVLYLALEDGPQRLHSRALRLTQTAPSGLYLCGQALPIGQGLEQQLERALEEHPGIRLIILDTLQKVRIESGSGMSYAADYRDASALKSVADRYHICLLAIHHLRKLPDEDPFNRLSGTNGLSGAADGSLVLLRTKRQENTAVLSATGRDIEDQEEPLEFDDCRWNRTADPEQLQFGLLVMLLQKLLRQDVFQGTATELADWLGKEGLLFGPAQLSRYLQSRGRQLAEAGIGLEVSRTNSKRTLRLWLGDRSDGCDSIPGEETTANMLSLPSPASQAS